MAVIQTDLPAVVLDCRDHAEADKIVTFFCKDIGKLTGIAKGAHRSKKRFVNKLELFSFLQITYSSSAHQSLALIRDADLLNSFLSIRTSVGRFQAASVVRELVLLASSEQLRDDALFSLVLWELHSLEKNLDHRASIALFLIKLFDCLGYRPGFSGCRNCGLAYRGKTPAIFSIPAGGLICSRCLQGGEFTGRHLSPGAIRLLTSVQRQSLKTIERISISDAVLKEVLDSLYGYGRYLFQRDIHSWRQFIDGAVGASHNRQPRG